MNGGKHPDLAIIIPVKRHSIRLKDKNLREINGVPLLKLAINKALQVTDEVYVSSSSDEMLTYARQWGAKAIKRPPELDGEVLVRKEVMHHAAQQMPEHIQRLMLLQCTNPMVKLEHLEVAAERDYAYGSTHCGAFYLMRKGDWDSDPLDVLLSDDAICIPNSVDIDDLNDLAHARQLLKEDDDV